MSDWIWIAVIAALVVALVLSWTRGDKSRATRAEGVPVKKDEAGAAPVTSRSPRAPAPSDPLVTTTKTTVTGTPKVSATSAAPPPPALPTFETEEDEAVDPTRIGNAPLNKRPGLQAPTKRIVFDEDAANEEPTNSSALILVTAAAQTDKGLRRKRNEDGLLVFPKRSVFVVADGMGGHSGGEVASALAVQTIEEAFEAQEYDGELHDGIPRRASELARAIQMANETILMRSKADEKLAGMGTTICAVRFSPDKQRVYVGHVGDSRLYRMRNGQLQQMTSDHTMKDFGVTGPGAGHLSRAVGIWPTVPIDVIIGKPRVGDLYLLCSDGLTKMLSDETIAEIIALPRTPAEIVETLIQRANASGGRDNITVILIRVDDPAAVIGAAQKKS